MVRTIIISVFLFFFLNAVGQENKTRLFVNNNFKTEEGGVVLKWISREVVADKGFNLYRKEGASWVKLNEEPIDIKSNYNINQFEDKDAYKVYDGLKRSDRAVIKGSILTTIAVVKAIEHPAMAEAIGITYYDLTAQKGNSYTYKVAALTSGGEVDLAESIPIMAGEYKPTKAPAAFELKRKKSQVNLKWKEEREAYFGNYVYRKTGNGDFVKLDSLILIPGKERNEFMQFTDLAIEKDSAYTYKVVGIDFFGQQTEFTPEIIAPPKQFDTPPAPVLLNPEIKTSKKQVILSWNYPDVQGVKGFNVYQFKDTDDSLGSKMNKELIGFETNESILELDSEGGYYYKVAAVIEDGTEGFSNAVFAEIHDLFPPLAITNLSAKVDTGMISFNWKSSSSDDFLQYVLWKAIPSDTAIKRFTRVGSTTETNYQEKFARNVKSAFCYYIEVEDTNHNFSAPSNWQCVKLPDLKAPRSPVIKRITSDSNGVIITWVKNAEDDLMGYEILRKGEKDSAFKRLNISDLDYDQYRYVDRRVQGGQKYYYQMVAIDESNNKSVGSKPFPIRLPEESKIEEGPYDVVARYNLNKKQVNLKWKQDFKKGMVGYTVYAAQKGNIMIPVSGLISSEAFVHKVEGNEKNMEYQIRIYDELGYIKKSETISVEIKIEE